MKKLNYLLSAVVLLAVLVTVGCSKDDGPGKTAEEQVTEKMSKTWVMSSATLESQPVTDLSGLTLTITDALAYSTNSNSVTRTPNPWPVGGSWAFKTEITDASTGSFVITRDSELDINVTLTDTNLTLNFLFDDTHTTNEGREDAVKGSWVFVYDAQ